MDSISQHPFQIVFYPTYYEILTPAIILNINLKFHGHASTYSGAKFGFSAIGSDTLNKTSRAHDDKAEANRTVVTLRRGASRFLNESYDRSRAFGTPHKCYYQIRGCSFSLKEVFLHPIITIAVYHLSVHWGKI